MDLYSDVAIYIILGVFVLVLIIVTYLATKMPGIYTKNDAKPYNVLGYHDVGIATPENTYMHIEPHTKSTHVEDMEYISSMLDSAEKEGLLPEVVYSFAGIMSSGKSNIRQASVEALDEWGI